MCAHIILTDSKFQSNNDKNDNDNKKKNQFTAKKVSLEEAFSSCSVNST